MYNQYHSNVEHSMNHSTCISITREAGEHRRLYGPVFGGVGFEIHDVCFLRGGINALIAFLPDICDDA